jgi:hypothetical protein
MINAREARALVAESSVKLLQRLEAICAQIEVAAKLGRSEIWLDIALPHHKEFIVEPTAFYPVTFTPIQAMVAKGLTDLDFAMRIENRRTKIGGGLGSMDDEVTYEDLPYIKVTWY